LSDIGHTTLRFAAICNTPPPASPSIQRTRENGIVANIAKQVKKETSLTVLFRAPVAAVQFLLYQSRNVVHPAVRFTRRFPGFLPGKTAPGVTTLKNSHV
jgi:hypothetical protein